jgi:hypothetical protein
MNCKTTAKHTFTWYTTLARINFNIIIFIFFFHSTLGGDKYYFSSSYLLPLSFSVSTLGGDKSTQGGDKTTRSEHLQISHNTNKYLTTQTNITQHSQISHNTVQISHNTKNITHTLEKIHRAVTFDPTHISSLNSCIPQYTCDP